MPKGLSFYSPGVDKVNQSRQVVKCGSDDSGQDASWKPDDDEMAGEMDDDEDVTSDGKSTPEEEDGSKSRNERRNDIPSKRGIDRKGNSARRSCPTPNQDWKDSRKSMKGLRELAALIDGSAQLHESKTRTRRQAGSTQRKFENGNGHDGRLDGEYASCSSGDSSWSNRSGSSILGGSPRNERSRMEPLKPTFRSPMKLQERPHESHINSAFDRSLCTPQKILSKGFSEKANTSRILDDCPATTSGRSAINPDEALPDFKSCDDQADPLRELNPSKRQRLGSPTKDFDQGASGQLDDNIDDIGEHWGAGMLTISHEDPKERITNCKQDGDGDETSKRSHSGLKIKKTPMIKHENAWYRARILKSDSDSGRIFVEFTGFEDGSLAKPFWIREDSSRIWTGSYRGKDWKHLGDGAWKPKPPSTKNKKRLKGIKRGKKGQPDADMHNSRQLVTHVKDSTDQMISQGDGTNMETEDMEPHQNSNNDGEGANVGTSRAAREAAEVTQKFMPVEVKREAANPSSKGPKLPRPPRRSTASDTHPGNRDSGTYPQGDHQSLERNDGATFLGSRPSLAEEYESQNRNTDGPSESGISHDRKGEKRICNRSDEAGHEPRIDRGRMGKMKSSLGVLSEGVGSAGDSQGSQVCPLKKSHLKMRNGGPYDDTVYSSPSSESPLSHMKSVSKSGKGGMGAKSDKLGAAKKNPSVDQHDSVQETADAGKLGWKVGWKRHVKGEQRSSDDLEDAEDLDGNPDQLTPKASTSLPTVDAALKPTFPSLKNSNSEYFRLRKGGDGDQNCREEEAKTLQYGRGSESDKGVGGRRSSKRNDRSRTATKLRINHAIDDERNTDRDGLVKLEPALVPSFPQALSTFAHIRKHLPYYNEHIPDQKLEAFVEMMERLDAVPGTNPSPDHVSKVGTGDCPENSTPSASKQPQQTMGQSASGPNHQLNHFVPIPFAQPQGQSQNVQFPLSSTWPLQNQQPHLQAQQVMRTPETQPSIKLNQHRVSGGNRSR